jgi:hypothetical protein
MTFAEPAPSGARLRFNAVCNVDVAFDGGGYTRAVRQPESVHRPELASSYFVPVPAGAQSVQYRFSADDWYSGPCVAKDASLFSLTGTTPTTTAPTTTAVPTTTATAPSTTTVPPTTTSTTVPPTTTVAPLPPCRDVVQLFISGQWRTRYIDKPAEFCAGAHT